MDPDANLQEQRKLAKRIITESMGAFATAVLGDRLAELAQAMDEWLSKGGHLPKDWKR